MHSSRKEEYLEIYFFLSCLENVGTHQKHLSEVLLMITNKICFVGKKERKILQLFGEKKPILSEV